MTYSQCPFFFGAASGVTFQPYHPAWVGKPTSIPAEKSHASALHFLFMWMLNSLPFFQATNNKMLRNGFRLQEIGWSPYPSSPRKVPNSCTALQGFPSQVPINQVSCHRSSAAFCAVSKAASIAERQLGQLPYLSIQGFRHSSWNKCWHGKRKISCFSSILSKHTAHVTCSFSFERFISTLSPQRRFLGPKAFGPRSVATPSAPAAPPRRLPWRNREAAADGVWSCRARTGSATGGKVAFAVRRPKEAQGCGPKDRLELNSWGIHLGASNKWSELNG